MISVKKYNTSLIAKQGDTSSSKLSRSYAKIDTVSNPIAPLDIMILYIRIRFQRTGCIFYTFVGPVDTTHVNVSHQPGEITFDSSNIKGEPVYSSDELYLIAIMEHLEMSSGDSDMYLWHSICVPEYVEGDLYIPVSNRVKKPRRCWSPVIDELPIVLEEALKDYENVYHYRVTNGKLEYIGVLRDDKYLNDLLSHAHI